MNNNVHPKVTFQLYTDVKCFGPGVAELLLNVEKHRSLRSAANSMNMAYSKAWTIIKTCENEFGFKLLNSTTGGKNGGGAQLTEEAKKLLDDYFAVYDELKKQADMLFESKLSWLNGKDTEF